MVRAPCFDSNGIKKGAWSEEEDDKLRAFILTHGHWNWRLLPKYAGLARCGKSCRLRWVNYLKPGVKRGNFTKQEEDLIIKLHTQLGNKWSIIATYLPGRTDNDIKNFWNAHIEKPSKRKLYPKNVKWQTSELASHVLKEENLSSTSLIKLQEPSWPFDATSIQADQVDIWPHNHMFLGDYDPKKCLPPLIDESEWIALDHDRVSCDEYVSPPVQEYVAPNFQNYGISCYDDNIPPPLQEDLQGGFYDPLFDFYFSYGMHFIS